jgi:3-oxoadipate enol-lactonase
MPILLSNDPPLNVTTNGDDRRPALLLLNPLGTTLDVWDPMIDKLVEQNYVIRFDMRGHGQSGPVESGMTMDDLVDDAVHVLDSLEVPRAHLLGASLGGLVAVNIACRHPERVDRMVLVSTAIRLGPDYWWQRVIDTVAEDGLESVAEHVHSILYSPAWAEANPESHAAAVQMFVETPVPTYLAGAELILATDIGPTLAGVRDSVLLVVGDDDPVLRHHPAEDLLARIPDSEAVLVSGARHRVFVEHPREIAEVVCEFLTDPDGR